MVTFLNFLILIGVLSGVTLPVALLPGLTSRYQKRSALRDYVRRLGRVLRVRHGLQEHYSTAQVITMMRKWGYSTAHDGYGLALYCSQADFDGYYSTMTEPYDYNITREELIQHLPFSDTGFSAVDVIELGDRLNAQGRILKQADDNIYDSSDLDLVSAFIRSNKGKDYGDNFEDRGKGSGGSTTYYSGFGGLD
ncbi:MAG: DUF6559 family protein [Cyanobacteria bacterium J06634_6]